MINPWLQIPASDYEGHLGSPKVAQLTLLAQTFKEVLNKHESKSIALLGCATGNGLEYINNKATKRITAIDINPEYLEILRQRFEYSLPRLEIVEADLEKCTIENQAYTLVFAGLIFEYLKPQALLNKIASCLCPGGVMVSILQLPAGHLAKVSDTPYASLKSLNSIMKLISPQQFQSMTNKAGLREIEANVITIESGKPFYISTYAKI